MFFVKYMLLVMGVGMFVVAAAIVANDLWMKGRSLAQLFTADFADAYETQRVLLEMRYETLGEVVSAIKRATMDNQDEFRDLIDGLYRTSFVELQGDGFRVRIPLWFYRDLGILEDEIALDRRHIDDLVELRPG